jgi:hypothetical protein
MMGLQGWRARVALARLALAGALAILGASESRAAGLIPITFDQTRPVIVATDGSVAYNASTDGFNVQATGLFFVANDLLGGVLLVPVDSGSAISNLTLGHSGDLLGAGSIALSGGIDFDQDGKDDVTSSLVTGTVTAFGAGPLGIRWVVHLHRRGPDPAVHPPLRRRDLGTDPQCSVDPTGVPSWSALPATRSDGWETRKGRPGIWSASRRDKRRGSCPFTIPFSRLGNGRIHLASAPDS